MVSSRARSMRASTGDSPPLETATMIGERSMIDGRMKLHSSGVSATFTGMWRARRISDEPGSGVIILDHDYQILAVEQTGRERIGHPIQMVGMRQTLEARVQGRRGDIDTRAGAQQQFSLAGCGFAAAHHQTVTVAQVEENGQIVHGIYSVGAASSPDSAGPSSAE